MISKSTTKVVILAAGKGVRMQDERPKALVLLRGKPLISYIIKSARASKLGEVITVIGHKNRLVQREIKGSTTVIQKLQLGTAHALLAAKPKLKRAKYVMVLYGDHPFIKPSTLKKVFLKHIHSGAKITFCTTKMPNFRAWRKVFFTHGRILRKNKEIVAIREFKDASEGEKILTEVNAGGYIFETKWLWKNIKKTMLLALNVVQSIIFQH